MRVFCPQIGGRAGARSRAPPTFLCRPSKCPTFVSSAIESAWPSRIFSREPGAVGRQKCRVLARPNKSVASTVENTRVKLLLAIAVAVYFVSTVTYLDRFPLIGQDEPWIAAPAYKLATQGVLGSDIFAGFHGMERHHLVHMPVYAIAEAA